ncbi:MAG TPA: hypothetical protein VEZ90_02960 [Blastocatellia bacterium]|nr:hypothetical protein [Blastocatellia bacterium]
MGNFPHRQVVEHFVFRYRMRESSQVPNVMRRLSEARAMLSLIDYDRLLTHIAAVSYSGASHSP